MTAQAHNRELLFSVTLDDCKVSHMRAGGPGGQHQNKRDTATLIIHEPSGARGEAREHRSQRANTKAAFRRMVASPQFRFWLAEETRRRNGERSLEEQVASMLSDPAQMRVEVRDEEGRWVEVPAGHVLAVPARY